MSANHESGAALSGVQEIAAVLEERMPDDFDETPPVEDEVTEEVAEESTAEAVNDEPDTDVEDETETEASDESTESDDQEANDDEEAPEFHSIEELAEALELSPDEFLDKIKGKVKINGEETEVTLSELTKGYQMESDYRRKTMELADNRKAFESEQETARNTLQTRVTEANNMLATLEQGLMGEYQAVDWNTLREQEPTQYLMMQQDFQNRQAQIEHVKQSASQEAQRLHSEAQHKQEQSYSTLITKESEALMSAIPEWQDADKAKKGKSEIKEFLHQYNFSDSEIANIIDHRHVLMIRDAMKGKSAVTKEDAAVKKVKKLPKLVKPGAKQTKASVSADRQNDLKKKLRKNNGSVQSVAEILLDRMN